MTLAWNLLYYETAEQYQVDSQLSPLTAGGSTLEPVTVTQFGQASPGIWIMVVAQPYENDPSSYSARLALQYFPDTTTLNFINPNWIKDLDTISISGFIANGFPKKATSQELNYQLVSDLLGAVPTNIVHEIWYLLGYPDEQWLLFDGPTISQRLSTLSGTIIAVTVYTDTSSNSVQPVSGLWILLKIQTVIDSAGIAILDPTLVLDGWLRLIYDFDTNTMLYALFPRTNHIQIMDLSGTVILDGIPIPGLQRASLSGPRGTARLPTYAAQGVFFDGATGLVTRLPILTKNTSIISFAGWFKSNWALNAPAGSTPKLEFSQGSGSNRVFVDDSQLDSTGWHHYMGTINGATQEALLLVDGVALGQKGISGSSFNAVATDGTSVTIGSDTQGNFFIGDVADLSIWLDNDWITLGAIPESIISLFVTTDGFPANPAFAIERFGVPDLFINGPADLITSTPVYLIGGQVPVPGIGELNYITGRLIDSTSSPSDIP